MKALDSKIVSGIWKKVDRKVMDQAGSYMGNYVYDRTGGINLRTQMAQTIVSMRETIDEMIKK